MYSQHVVLAAILGALFLWAGASGRFDIKTFGIGLLILLFGSFSMSRAVRAWHRLKAISRA